MGIYVMKKRLTSTLILTIIFILIILVFTDFAERRKTFPLLVKQPLQLDSC